MSRTSSAPGALPMSLAPLSRRRFLAGTAFAVTCWSELAPAQSPTGPPERVLRARPGSAALHGEDRPPTAIWGYDGSAPGPLLRVRRGEDVRVRLANELPEPTTIHWHGIRLPNAMDGVPDLTQPPVAPGASFEYRFRPPDAGTFWYRPAGNAAAQVGRGLCGALIVDEPTPVAVDRDMVMVFEDWPPALDGSTEPAIGEGRHITVNGAPAFELPARTNERLRIRLVNAALARTLTLRFDRHAPMVMAIDGQPAEPFLARDSRLMLGPGNRLDLFVDLTLAAGERASILLEETGAARAIVDLAYAGEPVRPALLSEPSPLPPNPLPARLDLRGAARHELALDALVPLPAPLHQRAPAFTVRRGRVVVLTFSNRADVAQSVHVHGHAFRLLDRLDDGWKPYWLDTLTLGGRQTDRVAFLADNPGKWLIGAQPLAAQRGTAAWFAVT
jgi:FtsP/CotA-like multicopper oxidase with cupredoxin domain